MAAERDKLLADDLAATAEGDRTAFRRVYHAAAPRLLAICFNVTRDQSSAEDVLQTVFIKIWQSAGRFDRQRAQPMTWMGYIARNCAIDWYRTQQSKPEFADRFIDMISDVSEPIDVRLMREAIEDRALSLVSDFDEKLESQVRRIYLEGMTYAQAAERDGLPIGTLKSRVRRALAALKSKLLYE